MPARDNAATFAYNTMSDLQLDNRHHQSSRSSQMDAHLYAVHHESALTEGSMNGTAYNPPHFTGVDASQARSLDHHQSSNDHQPPYRYDTSVHTTYTYPMPSAGEPARRSVFQHRYRPDPRMPYHMERPNSREVRYTDDVSTKLSDTVKRQCFNCHSPETSTWRRSTLSPGKILCNKCGLYERTHGIVRPSQIPSRRGASSSLANRRLDDRNGCLNLPTPVHHRVSNAHDVHPDFTSTTYTGMSAHDMLNNEA